MPRCRAWKRSRWTSPACCGPWPRSTRRRPAREPAPRRRCAGRPRPHGRRAMRAASSRCCAICWPMPCPSARRAAASPSSPGAKAARIRLSVADQGPGIPPDKLDAIFDRFYTERPAGEKFGTHSGLGLSISRQIVRGPWRAALRREPDRSGRHHPRRALHAPPAGRMNRWRAGYPSPSPALRNGERGTPSRSDGG